MTRFIQQRIRPMVSRFFAKAPCPSCGSNGAPLPLNGGSRAKWTGVVSGKKEKVEAQAPESRVASGSPKTTKNKKK